MPQEEIPCVVEVEACETPLSNQAVPQPSPALSGPSTYYTSPEFATWLSSMTADGSPVDEGAAAALYVIYGSTWIDQLENERKEIHGTDRNLKEFYLFKLSFNHPIEDVLQV